MMNITIPASSFRWLTPIALIFFVGGSIQYLGLLSQTQTNWVAMLLLGHVFLLRSTWQQLKHEFLLFGLLLYIAVAHIIHDSAASYTATYFYYILCAIVAATAGRAYANRALSFITLDRYFRLATAFLLLQLMITSLQALFTQQFISLSRTPIGEVDAIFGTFFLQSDAALAAVCELITISTFILPCKLRNRVVIPALSLAIIFIGNSNTARFTILFLLATMCAWLAYRRLNLNRHGFSLLTAGFILILSISLYHPAVSFVAEFLVQIAEDYENRGGWETASRFAPLGQFYTEGVSFIGQGALTYYNPITKVWLYNSGFSTLYPLYIDYGLIGISFYGAYQAYLILRMTKGYMEPALFAVVLLSFSMFNFALTDLTFILSFNAILYFKFIYEKSRNGMNGNVIAKEAL